MRSRINILIAAALATTCASPLFAGPLVYKQAAAPWSAEQALKLPPAITPEFLKEVQALHGGAAAEGLADKKEKVSSLTARFKACALKTEDLATAEKYFIPEFSAEVRYYANGGCAAALASAQARPAASRPAPAEKLGALAASKDLFTSEGAARFFDGASARGAAALPAVYAGGPAQARPAAAQPAPAAARPSRPLSSKVPLPPSMRAALTPPERPADLGKDGRVHQAMAYWLSLRRENLAALKTGELSGAEKAKAAGKLAAGAVFHGLLWVSNLDNVEIAASRLGWDVGQGAGAGVIASDAAKLIFHSAVFAMLLAPIPLSKVAKAVLAGEPWAIAFVGAMASGPLNRYWLHFAD
ncbi:MAG TPA: hypothetical protein DEQ38_03795 [Elusimicrobia bacterium]|nr:MAG: hypothetical protein A2089_13135 [Elusimicrobia bacterium GWD2_63_28]HCC47227.1 hypothetical protein [Elusimicrobiota bacterium]